MCLLWSACFYSFFNFLNLIFLMWTIFKVFTGFVTNVLLVWCFGFLAVRQVGVVGRSDDRGRFQFCLWEDGPMLGLSWAHCLYLGNQLNCKAKLLRCRIERFLGEHLRPWGWPSKFLCSLWLLKVVQQTLKSCFKMVQPDPKVWLSSCLPRVWGSLLFSSKLSEC